jgi:hypothetical protein
MSLGESRRGAGGRCDAPTETCGPSRGHQRRVVTGGKRNQIWQKCRIAFPLHRQK